MYNQLITHIKSKLLMALLALFLCGSLPPAAQGVSVRLLSLDELIETADRVLWARVEAIEERNDELGLPATFITLSVSERLKGDTPATLTIKQVGRITPDADGRIFRISGLPTYQIDEELIIFLHRTSVGGFTSPVGFGQGKFRVIREGQEAFVINNPQTLHTLSQMFDPSQLRSENLADRVLLDSFLSVIKEKVRTNPNTVSEP